MLCTANKYCPGSGPVGTVSTVAAASSTPATDGIAGCPTGSTLAAAVVATAATANNAITDCVVSPGYYINDEGDENEPVLCAANHYCPGGATP